MATSNLTSRYWYSSLWYYTHIDNIPNPEKCASAVRIETGVSDVQWVSEKIIVAGLDSGKVSSYSSWHLIAQGMIPHWYEEPVH